MIFPILVPELTKKLKVATFDIETTGLDCAYHNILATAIKPYGRHPKIYRVDSIKNNDLYSDKWVVEETINELNKYDVIVTWYGSRFDFPFINGRALKFGLTPPAKNYRRDLWWYSRNYLKLPSNRLKFVHKYIFGITNKTEITPKITDGAIRRNKSALNFIVHHVKIDVKETEDLYPILGVFFSKRLRK